MHKNEHMLQGIHRIYNNDTSKIKTINVALNKININDVLMVINKYTGITQCDIDLIKIIVNAKKNDMNEANMTTDIQAFLTFLLNSEDISYTFTVSYDANGEYEEDAAELIEIFNEANENTDDYDKFEMIYNELIEYGGSLYAYCDLLEKYKNMFTVTIHVNGITNYTRAPVISYMLLSLNQFKDRSEYIAACHILDKIRLNPTNKISTNLSAYTNLNTMGGIHGSDVPGIYAYRMVSELFLAALLSDDRDDPGSSTHTKRIEELDTIHRDVTNLDQQNKRYDVIDYLLTAIGGQKIKNNNKVARLDMMYMIDEYPAGSRLNTQLFKTIERFQSHAKDALGMEPKASIYHADGNYKASIMRNVCLTKCETEYAIIKDDDDIGCSLIELCTMIEEELQKQKYPDDIGLLTLPAADINRSITMLYGMWRFVYRPRILRLFSINNPPFLMAGEDAITIKYIDNLIHSNALNIDASRYFVPYPGHIIDSHNVDTIAMYIYLTHSDGAKDRKKQAIEERIYKNTMNTILGLPLSDSIEITVKDQTVKEEFIKELNDYTPLFFDRVYSFKKLDIKDVTKAYPFYAFATNRPTKEELTAARAKFNDPWFDKMIPRKCKLNESTGVVTVIDDDNPILEINGVDKKTFTMEEWDAALSNYLKKHESNYIAILTMDTPSINANVRTKLFGGKQINGTFKWLLSIILSMIVLLFVCYAIRCICKPVMPPCYHSSYH